MCVERMATMVFILSLAVVPLGQQAALVTAAGKWFDNRGNTYLSEKVARFQTESALAKESALSNIPSKRSCISGSGSAESVLTGSLLKKIINSAVPNTFPDTPSVNTYYAILDYGQSLASNPDPLQIFWPGYLDISNLSPIPKKFWLNFLPFANTSRGLISFYEGHVKPTIQIIGITATETDMVNTVEKLKCLAKLKKLGFKLQGWNVTEFKNHMTEQYCKNQLTNAMSTNNFIKSMAVVQSLLEDVEEFTKHPQVLEWCPTGANMQLSKLQVQAMK